MTINPLSDLSITKTYTGKKAKVGGIGEYTLLVKNLGPTNNPNPITVKDNLPTGVKLLSITGKGWDCTATGECQKADGLTKDTTSKLIVKVQFTSKAYPQVSNTATVTSDTIDIDSSNNTSTTTIPVAPLINLGIHKTVANVTGKQITWNIKVTNKGPNDTTDKVVVTDNLPSSLKYVHLNNTTNWTCVTSNNKTEISCTLKKILKAGDNSTFQIITNATRTGKLTNTATVTSGGDKNTSLTSTSTTTLPNNHHKTNNKKNKRHVAKTGLTQANQNLIWIGLLGILMGGGTIYYNRKKRS